MKKLIKIVSRVYKIINIVIIALLLFFLGVNIYTAAGRYIFKNDLPKVFGMANAIVVTGSMRDAIDPGDIVIIKEKEEYKVGDIITFRQGGAIITHRIIEITETGVITKGDANNTADAEAGFEQIEGKVVLVIPKVGIILGYLKTPTGILVMFAVIAIIITLKDIPEKFARAKKEKHANKV